MDNIWLLFFIGYAIYKIFGKKLPDVAGRIPRDREKMPRQGRTGSPDDWRTGFPWDLDDEEAETAAPPPITVAGKPAEKQATVSTRLETQPGPKVRTIEQADTPTGADEVSEPGVLSLFEGDALVNGIIFSEILRSPRARHRRNRGFDRY